MTDTNKIGGDFDSEEEVDVVEIEGRLYEKFDELEHKGEVYFALAPYIEYDEDEDETDEELIVEFGILKRIEENGEYMLEDIDDDDLLDELGAMFERRFDELTQD
ncbi:MAG: DUF1292 domain-containing protein [Oscillospiraceae bacterium]|nr:DUF1292 domain-containing protein [Oscillospiraceae bacterium]